MKRDKRSQKQYYVYKKMVDGSLLRSFVMKKCYTMRANSPIITIQNYQHPYISELQLCQENWIAAYFYFINFLDTAQTTVLFDHYVGERDVPAVLIR
jgi:hypothetical protein